MKQLTDEILIETQKEIDEKVSKLINNFIIIRSIKTSLPWSSGHKVITDFFEKWESKMSKVVYQYDWYKRAGEFAEFIKEEFTFIKICMLELAPVMELYATNENLGGDWFYETKGERHKFKRRSLARKITQFKLLVKEAQNEN